MYDAAVRVPSASSEGEGVANGAGSAALAVRAGVWICALPLALVEEVMRPHPIQPVRAAPDFVLGAARLRGQAVPVVALTALWSGQGAVPTRFVLLRTFAPGESESRTVALAVEDVIGVVMLPESDDAGTAPLLRDADPSVVDEIFVRDEALAAVLSAARVVPASVWQAVQRGIDDGPRG